MKRTFQIVVYTATLLLSGIAFNSCGSNKKVIATAREWAVHLRDSIGIVHIALPLKYDTMHSWLCQSDYAGGDEYHYRIQPSAYSINEEGCFIRLMPDSFRAFTIAHYRLFEGDHPFDPHTSMADLVRAEAKNGGFHMGQDFDTACIWIDGRDCSYIYHLDHYREGNTTNTIHVTTKFNHRLVMFDFESTLSNTKDSTFIGESLAALRTIRFEQDK